MFPETAPRMYAHASGCRLSVHFCISSAVGLRDWYSFHEEMLGVLVPRLMGMREKRSLVSLGSPSFPSLSYAMPERTETGSAPFLREQPRSSEDLIARELGSNEDGRRVLERAGRDFLLLDELRPVDELRVELDALFHRVPHDEGRNAYLLAGVDDRVFLRAVF